MHLIAPGMIRRVSLSIFQQQIQAYAKSHIVTRVTGLDHHARPFRCAKQGQLVKHSTSLSCHLFCVPSLFSLQTFGAEVSLQVHIAQFCLPCCDSKNATAEERG